MMEIMPNQKLYIVEFGKPDKPGFSGFGNTDYIYIVAETYNQAAGKALAYRKEYGLPITSMDGSLLGSEEMTIKLIKLASEQVII